MMEEWSDFDKAKHDLNNARQHLSLALELNLEDEKISEALKRVDLAQRLFDQVNRRSGYS